MTGSAALAGSTVVTGTADLTGSTAGKGSADWAGSATTGTGSAASTDCDTRINISNSWLRNFNV
jgi:hypothetical protein